jgi:hypothetical protein
MNNAKQAFNELHVIIEDLFNGTYQVQRMDEVRDIIKSRILNWQSRWFETYFHKGYLSDLVMSSASSDKYEEHFKQDMKRNLGDFVLNTECIITQEKTPFKPQTAYTAQITVLRKEPLPSGQGRVSAKVSYPAAGPQYLPKAKGTVFGEDVTINIKNKAFDEHDITIKRINEKIASSVSFPKDFGVPVFPICECGKDKHGFASHATWCKKYNK